MRCPKCGYISFDHLESCKKCKKFFGPLATELNGTIHDAIAPSFLNFSTGPSSPSSPPVVQSLEIAGDGQEKEPQQPLREGIDTEFILGDEPIVPQQQDIFLTDTRQELTVDLDDFEEVSPVAEYTLDLDKESKDIEDALPTLDFGDLDISDLAPPAKRPAEAAPDEEALVLTTETVAASSAPPVSPQDDLPRKPSGLEDLHFNGLDLEAPAKIVSGSAAGKRYLPSVKTGTALDNFDIDLGDLFGEKKK